MMMINSQDSWGQWWSSRSLLSSHPACHFHDEDICAVSRRRRRRLAAVSVPASTWSLLSGALTSQRCSFNRGVTRADSRQLVAWHAESNLTGARQRLMDGWRVFEWPLWKIKAAVSVWHVTAAPANKKMVLKSNFQKRQRCSSSSGLT